MSAEGGENPSVKISGSAYTKMMMHAAKYPAYAIDGLCIGQSSQECIMIADVVPLFHNGTLVPMLEAATAMVEKHAKNNDAALVGYYFANEHIDDESAGRAPSIGNALSAKGQVCLVQISNSKLADPEDSALRAYFKDSNHWNKSQQVVEVNSAVTNLFIDAIDQGLDIIDFDRHLLDVSNDWRNMHINAWLKQQAGVE